MSKRLLAILLLLLCNVAMHAQRYPRKKILKDLNTLPGFENAFIGFTLYDPDKRKVIASQYADKDMTPASTTKLFTYYSGTRHLGKVLPALEYQLKGDSLIFWSTGYPLTLHPDHPDSTVIKFLAESDKNLYYWPRPIRDERFGPGWGWDDFNGYYGAEKSAFPVYGNSVRVVINNEEKTWHASPNHPGFKFQVKDTAGLRSRVNRDEFWNDYEIEFKELSEIDSIPIDTLTKPFRYSNALFTDLLSQASQKKIHQLDDFQRPEEFEVLPGVAADSLYKWMLQPSDNLFAEQILLMVSGMYSDTLSTRQAIRTVQNDLQIRSYPPFVYNLTWVDGSGLSRYNMFKPNEILTLLELLDLRRTMTLLPQGMVSGTLDEWYSPEVFAKTGTLSNNHSLAGYIQTQSGKTLIFVLMANHYTAPTDTIRQSFGTILEKIRRAY